MAESRTKIVVLVSVPVLLPICMTLPATPLVRVLVLAVSKVSEPPLLWTWKAVAEVTLADTGDRLLMPRSQLAPMFTALETPALPPVVIPPMFMPLVVLPATEDSVAIGLIFTPLAVPPVVKVVVDRSTNTPFDVAVPADWVIPAVVTFSPLAVTVPPATVLLIIGELKVAPFQLMVPAAVCCSRVWPEPEKTRPLIVVVPVVLWVKPAAWFRLMPVALSTPALMVLASVGKVKLIPL